VVPYRCLALPSTPHRTSERIFPLVNFAQTDAQATSYRSDIE